jgi:hypothetical protein
MGIDPRYERSGAPLASRIRTALQTSNEASATREDHPSS